MTENPSAGSGAAPDAKASAGEEQVVETCVMTSVLGLVEVAASREVRAGFLGRRLRLETYIFQDWTIDGTPLRQFAGVEGGGRHPSVLGPVTDVSYLVDGSDEAVPQLNRLLGRAAPDLPDGRVALLVCAFDWDLGCGALSARLDRDGDVVIWRDLGWQADCEPHIDYVQPPLTLAFEGSGYERVLTEARDHCSRRSAAPRMHGATWG